MTIQELNKKIATLEGEINYICGRLDCATGEAHKTRTPHYDRGYAYQYELEAKEK